MDFVRNLGLQMGRSKNTEKSTDVMHTDSMSFDLLHAAMGLSTESAEILDLLKKHIAYTRPIDRQKLLDELGDMHFYATMILLDQGATLDEVLKMNIAKLKARYPNGYTHADANNRNGTVETVAQRKAVEK
jgi:NTP pyrophosphatase (non-canonical NTP hydrolase)